MVTAHETKGLGFDKYLNHPLFDQVTVWCDGNIGTDIK